MKNKKMLLIIMVISLFMFIPSVNAENFTCSALGSDVYIDKHLAEITKYVILVMQVAAPVVLIIIGMVDLMKGVTAQKEDEIKKGQQLLIKRIIAAIILFFVFAITKFVISVTASSSNANVMNCASCFISGPDNGDCG